MTILPVIGSLFAPYQYVIHRMNLLNFIKPGVFYLVFILLLVCAQLTPQPQEAYKSISSSYRYQDQAPIQARAVSPARRNQLKLPSVSPHHHQYRSHPFDRPLSAGGAGESAMRPRVQSAGHARESSPRQIQPNYRDRVFSSPMYVSLDIALPLPLW
jgi:hypothetical protein